LNAVKAKTIMEVGVVDGSVVALRIRGAGGASATKKSVVKVKGSNRGSKKRAQAEESNDEDNKEAEGDDPISQDKAILEQKLFRALFSPVPKEFQPFQQYLRDLKVSLEGQEGRKEFQKYVSELPKESVNRANLATHTTNQLKLLKVSKALRNQKMLQFEAEMKTLEDINEAAKEIMGCAPSRGFAKSPFRFVRIFFLMCANHHFKSPV
jgi:hypothetical protein